MISPPQGRSHLEELSAIVSSYIDRLSRPQRSDGSLRSSGHYQSDKVQKCSTGKRSTCVLSVKKLSHCLNSRRCVYRSIVSMYCLMSSAYKTKPWLCRVRFNKRRQWRDFAFLRSLRENYSRVLYMDIIYMHLWGGVEVLWNVSDHSVLCILHFSAELCTVSLSYKTLKKASRSFYSPSCLVLKVQAYIFEQEWKVT